MIAVHITHFKIYMVLLIYYINCGNDITKDLR